MRRRARASPAQAAAAPVLLLLLLLTLAAAFDGADIGRKYGASETHASRLEPGVEARSSGDATAPPATTPAPRPVPSLRVSESFTACSSNGSKPLHLTYMRPTVTPVVFIRDGGPKAQPCAVLKLACRVHVSTTSVRAGYEGMGRYHETWQDMAWSEAAAQGLLEALSPAHFAGRGSGALLAHAGDDFLSRVPDECIWRGEGDPLVGAALRFIPGLHSKRITEEVMRRWVAHPATLRNVAATWIVDALLLNNDRRSRCEWNNNIFVGRDERLVALDFGEWNTDCGADSDAKVRQMTLLPTLSHCLLKSGKHLCASRGWRRALEAAVEMAAEACGEDAVGSDGSGGSAAAPCPRLAARMRAALGQDPYFQLAAQRPTLFHAPCRYGDDKKATYGACVDGNVPADDARLTLQRSLADSCVQRHGKKATAYLSSLTASRLAIFLEAAREQLAAC